MKKAVILIIACFTGFVMPSQAQWDTRNDARIDSLFRSIDHTNTPGAALGIVQLGKLIFSKGYGMANLENGIVFEPETVSDIGSVAKQFTCFALVLLARQGKLSLDDDIRQYFPELPDFGSPIRIRHLIHHISGLREIYGALELAGWQAGDGIRQEDARILVRNSKDLNFPVGSKYSYCNTGYMLLGDIISKVTSQPFESWMRTNIFDPLGMEHTYIMDYRGELFPRCADSYERGPNDGWLKVYDNSTAYGQGGIYSTIPDMAKWLGNLSRPVIGGQAAMDQMLQRGVLTTGDTLDYAFGLEHATYRGIQLIQHTGSSAGYRAMLAYIPAFDLGIIVKGNYSGFNAVRYVRGIIDILLQDHLQVAEAVSPRESAPLDTLSLSPEQLTTYTGRYYSPELESFLTLTIENSHLTLHQRRREAIELKAVKTDEFSAGSLTLQFKRSKGHITGLRLSSGGVENLWMQRMEEAGDKRR